MTLHTDKLPDHPFLAADLDTLGLTRQQLRDLVASGAVRSPFVGAYCPSHLPDSIEVRAQCAALVMPAHAVLCDRTAAWIHGVDCLKYGDLDVQPDVEVASVGGNNRVRRPGISGGKRALTDDDIVLIGGVAVTTPARTACDLACLYGRNDAIAVLDMFMRICGVTREELRSVCARFVRRRGVKQLREMIRLADRRSESAGESWTRLTIHDAGLPIPQPQVELTLPGWGYARLDLAYPRLKIAVEYFGLEFHGDSEQEHDEGRIRALERAGWIVIVVTKDDFRGARLDAWLLRLREAIEERRPKRNRRYARGETWPFR